MPKFTGKSDAYLWFVVHATQFLRNGGRLSFVVSSALLFSDYGVPLVRFIGHHFRIRAVIDSMVERWFPDADTNTILLLLEREGNNQARAANDIRFVRLRRPLALCCFRTWAARLSRRSNKQQLLAFILTADPTEDDPRMQVNLVRQQDEGGLQVELGQEEQGVLEEDEE